MDFEGEMAQATLTITSSLGCVAVSATVSVLATVMVLISADKL